MTASRDIIKMVVKSCVADLVCEFQKQPYTYLFECDLQADVYARLCYLLSEPVEVRGSGNPEHTYKTGIVHTEYWKSIDIVCLDPESENWSRMRANKGSDIHIYELPILVGIELKYRKMGDLFGLSSCLMDIQKLNVNNIQFPVALGFLQHQSYEDEFFYGFHPDRDYKEVSDIDPFGSVHVISPQKVWKINIPF